MTLHEYTYVFVIGTFFAMLDAFNNGASMSLRATAAFALCNVLKVTN